jgi:hypothetical protein
LDLNLGMQAINHVLRTATKRELEETWKAKWTEYQQQMRALANDRKLSVAARATWTRELLEKESLTRAENMVATLLRTEHIGRNDYLIRSGSAVWRTCMEV